MANPLLQQYIKVTEFLGLTLGPDYEVALHDMTDKNRSIIAIANNHISGRDVGAPLTNVKAILEEGGADMKDVIKTTVFLSDMNNFGAMNEVYAEFFGEGGYPSRSAVEVARLPKDALVEIEVIAVAP